MSAERPRSATLVGPIAVERDAERTGALARAVEGSRYVRPVSVTELVELRPAYHRLVHPVPAGPERRARMEAGRALHDRLERLLASPEHREVRIARDGLIGRVDVLDDVPVEIKTTGRLTEGVPITEARPLYVDQLGMYCALTERPSGRLIVVQPGPSGRPGATVYVATFRELPEIRRRMADRAEEFRRALAVRDPSGLPRCPWLGRGCEFEAAHACDCTGDEPPDPAPVRELLVGLDERAELARPVAELLERPAPTDAPATIERYRELAYPREAYWTRMAPDAAPEAPPRGAPDEGSASVEVELYPRLRGVLEGGSVGAFEFRTAPGEAPNEPVMLWEGAPLLLKTSRARWPARADRLALRQPHYLLELGLRCAALGVERGRLVIGYERPERTEDRLQVFDVRFAPLAPWIELLRIRRADLLEALARREPGPLPPCPEWMFAACPYRARCGDGPVGASADGAR